MPLRFRWGSLRNKIIAWSFIPTVMVLAAVALVAYFAYDRVAEELVLGRDRELVYFSASQLKDDLGTYSEILSALSRTSAMRSDDKMRQAAALRDAGHRLAYFDGGVVLLDNFGAVVASEPERSGISGQDWADRGYFKQILFSRKAVFSDIVNDGPDGIPVIVFAVPITGDQDEFLGALAGMFRVGPAELNPFYGSIAKVHLGDTGSAYLLDSHGRVIYHADQIYIGQDFSAYPTVQDVLNGSVGAIRSQNPVGEDSVSAYAPIPGTSWGLVLEDDWASISEADERYGRFLLLLLGFGIVLPALVVSVAVRRTIRPIHDLMAAAQQVAEGNFGLAIRAETGDEIEELASQFNRMSAELKESYSNLEQKVAARTKELTALYNVAAAASSSLDLDTVLERSLDQVLKVMGLEVGTIHLLAESGDVLELAASKGIQEEEIPQIQTLPLGTGMSSWVIERGEPLVVPNIAVAERPLRAVPAAANQAYVGVPIETRGQKLGVLSLVGEPGRRFKPEEVALLGSIADEVALAVDNAGLYNQTEQQAIVEKRRREMAEGLRDILAILNSNSPLEEILNYILNRACPLMEADAGGIYRLDLEKRGFSLSGTSGSLSGLEPIDLIPYGNWQELTLPPPVEPFSVSDIRVFLDTLYPHPELLSERQQNWLRVIGENYSTILTVPIPIGDSVFGYITFYYVQAQEFSQEYLSLGRTLGDQAALAIENARLRQQAEQLAVLEERSRLARELHDSVTQLLYSLTLFAEAGQRMNKAGDPERTEQFLVRLSETARQAHKEMRLLVFELRPPTVELEGLVGALQHRLDAVEKRSGIETCLQVEGNFDLSPAIEDELFRVAVEALNNALKHASATQVIVRLQARDHTFSLQVVDNGKGFDLDAASNGGGMGLPGMRERVEKMRGSLQILSKPGAGAQVIVNLEMEIA